MTYEVLQRRMGDERTSLATKQALRIATSEMLGNIAMMREELIK